MSGGEILKHPGRLARAGQVLAKAGVITPEPPGTVADAARALLEWKMTPAAAFVVSAKRFAEEPAIIDEQGSFSFGEVAPQDERARARVRRRGDRRGRRRGDHVPRPQVVRRDDDRPHEARGERALLQHRLRRASAGGGDPARGPARPSCTTRSSPKLLRGGCRRTPPVGRVARGGRATSAAPPRSSS